MTASSPFKVPASASEKHINFIGVVAKQSITDIRLAGLAVGGSWSQDSMDSWSDLDLNLVVYPQYFKEVIEHISDLAQDYGHLLALAQGKHTGEQRLFNCLYGPPLIHVDLKFFALPDFAIRVENPTVIWQRNNELSDLIARHSGQYPIPDQQWIEDQFWIWIHYGLNKIERGEYLEVVDHLGFLRNKVLGPLLSLKLNHEPRRIRRAEEKLPQELYTKLKSTLAIAEYQSLLKALLNAAQLYQSIRNPQNINLRMDAEALVLKSLQHTLANHTQS